MNEVRRLQYLQAMGIDEYICVAQLPGAAPSRRVALRLPEPPGVIAPGRELNRAASAIPIDMPDVSSTARKSAGLQQSRKQGATPGQVVQFKLAAIVSGGILWLEELGDTPLAREQTQLVHAMARAVSRDAAQGPVTEFAWPLNKNPQLDQGEDAAMAALTGFMNRLIEEYGCRALVLLGKRCRSRIARNAFSSLTLVETAATLEVIADPALKRGVWMDLQALVGD